MPSSLPYFFSYYLVYTSIRPHAFSHSARMACWRRHLVAIALTHASHPHPVHHAADESCAEFAFLTHEIFVHQMLDVAEHLAPPPISLEPGGDRRSNDISLSVHLHQLRVNVQLAHLSEQEPKTQKSMTKRTHDNARPSRPTTTTTATFHDCIVSLNDLERAYWMGTEIGQWAAMDFKE